MPRAMLPPTLLALLLVAIPATTAVLQAITQPEDVYAYPKYKITFLNGRPVLNETAQKWLGDGLRGGEREFLDLNWSSSKIIIPEPLKGIDPGTDDELIATGIADGQPLPSTSVSPKLQHMRLGPENEFLCLFIPPPEVPAYSEDTSQAPHPARTWELLQPLQGTCLYLRQGWFTYAYCHNHYVRQFRERDPQQPLGPKEPQEDSNEASYTLGHAPTTSSPSSDDEHDGHISVADNSGAANRLELARTAGHRYLIQRWGDGTVCDKTGRKREIEVQFHCSMTTTDMIYFIKETRTCQYTLVIHTPRLCGVPGFKSPREDLEDTPLRCRKIVSNHEAIEAADHTLPEAPYPFQRPLPKPLPAPTPTPATPKKDIKKGKDAAKDGDGQAQLLKAALEAILSRADGDGESIARLLGEDGIVALGMDEDGGMWIDTLDNTDLANGLHERQGGQQKPLGGDRNGPRGARARDEMLDEDSGLNGRIDDDLKVGDDEETVEIELEAGEDAERVMKMLQMAGFDVRLPSAKGGSKGSKDSDDDDDESP